jgi:hypothetical protein
MAQAKRAANKAAQDDDASKAEGKGSATEAAKLLKKAVHVIEDAQGVLKRTKEGGRYVNVTVIEAVETQGRAIEKKRQEVESILNQTSVL